LRRIFAVIISEVEECVQEDVLVRLALLIVC